MKMNVSYYKSVLTSACIQPTLILLDMISDNEPILTRYISVPKELSQLNCNAFVAGIVEAVLDGCQFVSYMQRCVYYENRA
jgi:hypothetical protein